VREEPFAAKRIVHNDGHGGAGITLSWGTSRLAADLGLQGHSGRVALLGAGVMGLSTARLVQEAVERGAVGGGHQSHHSVSQEAVRHLALYLRRVEDHAGAFSPCRRRAADEAEARSRNGDQPSRRSFRSSPRGIP
jgi:hypothetical protein